MYSGILIVDKEEGISSARVVSLVRAAFNQKKVGHTGTLDLEASGLLPIVLGKATKVSDYMMEKQKTYIAKAHFGIKTDTLDRAGEVIGRSDKVISKEELEAVLENYKGEIEQIPPMYSALKVNGKKLYDLAREGQTIDRKRRKVRIYDIKIIDFAFPLATIEVTCSKGTYIRTLIDDIGEDLGTLAYVKGLRRIRVGNFLVEDAIKSQDIMETDIEDLKAMLKGPDLALERYERYDLDQTYFKKIINGMTVRIPDKNQGLVRLYIDNEFIGLARAFLSKGEYFLKMEKVFYDR
ncbi:tRNA pseudouridine(55) synthase TruB [Anaerococcus sp. AGMB09787]|uniref:tRNA pseudouridine(55) synthase TruB n=1 Tax=Anaerococcus sp. AGMB09787 TaxID=2922869 RepID=UPI001FB0242E|nr:tRNA pseudouridine(55) synthase TruB [Anaerococcus sp. AGMB09787]